MEFGRWGRIVKGILIASAVVLVGTGAWLSFGYEPSADGAWIGSTPAANDLATAIRLAHRGVAFLVMAVVVGLAALVTLRRVRRMPAPGRWMPVLVALALTIAAGVTGYLVAWDQMAVHMSTYGASSRGLVQPLLEDSVAFFLFGDAEVAKATVATWFMIHAVAIPLALVPVVVRARRPDFGASRPGG